MHNAKYYYRLFWIIVIIDLLLLASYKESYRIATKPLLIPMLILAYNEKTNRSKGLFRLLILFALGMSWLGDVFLYFEATFGAMFFMFGLGSFLIAHLLYISYFLQIKSEKPGYLQVKPLWALPVVIFSSGLLYFLWPHLGELQIPVALYALIITTMLLTAINSIHRFSTDAHTFFLLGALLFVSSDSLLAINKFYFNEQPKMLISILVMLTYCMAQFLLTKGSIHHLYKKHRNKEKINTEG